MKTLITLFFSLISLITFSQVITIKVLRSEMYTYYGSEIKNIFALENLTLNSENLTSDLGMWTTQLFNLNDKENLVFELSMDHKDSLAQKNKIDSVLVIKPNKIFKIYYKVTDWTDHSKNKKINFCQYVDLEKNISYRFYFWESSHTPNFGMGIFHKDSESIIDYIKN
jgi:hypothetical protein